jgi:hypothetical protein
MSDHSKQGAPDLGAGTDAQQVDVELDPGSDEPTMDTPDELGGTGGKQSGGAG